MSVASLLRTDSLSHCYPRYHSTQQVHICKASSTIFRKTHGQLLCLAELKKESSEKGRSAKESSFRERLKNNPAYQRLKQTTWQNNYKPSDADRGPGPIPEHLLTDNAEPSQKKSAGSITQYVDATERSEVGNQSQPQASTSGRQSPAVSGLGSQDSLPATISSAGSRASSSRMSRVRFWLQFHAQFGQRMRIVGSHESLGSWMVSQGGELQWSTGDKWNTIIEIPAGAIVEYKYVLVGPDGLSALAWQQGNNNVLAVGHADDNIEVFDTWESGPGAAVIAAGEETTREGRMLSWANEVESLFASQRNDLRKSRMELLAAQDEARLAREEARQFRAELRSSKAELTKAELRVRELTVSNRMLKTQLSETNHSFRHALETTHRFLLEAENALTTQGTSETSEEQESLEIRGGSGSPTASAGGRKKATATKRASTRKPRKSKRDAEAEATAAAEAKQALDSQEASAGDISEAESVDFGSELNGSGTSAPPDPVAVPENELTVASNGNHPLPQQDRVKNTA